MVIIVFHKAWQFSPLDSITLLSPIFKAWETGGIVQETFNFKWMFYTAGIRSSTPATLTRSGGYEIMDAADRWITRLRPLVDKCCIASWWLQNLTTASLSRLVAWFPKDTTSNLKHIIGPNRHGLWLNLLHVWLDALRVTWEDKTTKISRSENRMMNVGMKLSHTPYLLIMRACSSIRLPSPMIIGPASAMIRALGWTTVRAPWRRKK